jgi:hypothetical protein
VLKPEVDVETPSAAARSGFARSLPPVEPKFPGVTGTPGGSKKILRGPSELNHSTGLSGPPVKAPCESPTSTAATLIAAAAAVWPPIWPSVATSS